MMMGQSELRMLSCKCHDQNDSLTSTSQSLLLFGLNSSWSAEIPGKKAFPLLRISDVET